jgi:hypothetical protein
MASLVTTLKGEGFSHLAIEVAAQKQPIIDEYMRTGHREVLSADTWMNDEFIEILDAARREGMHIVCIDDAEYQEHGLDRGSVDEIMFRHLQERVLDKDPQAKVAIYIGNYHIDETEYLNFVEGERILETPRAVGRLGYLLEAHTHGKSHSIAITDSTALNCWEFGLFMREGIGKRFAVSLDAPLMHTIVNDAFFKTTFGGSYDALIGL